jgi:hypothetical protein
MAMHPKQVLYCHTDSKEKGKKITTVVELWISVSSSRSFGNEFRQSLINAAYRNIQEGAEFLLVNNYTHTIFIQKSLNRIIVTAYMHFYREV